MERKLDRVAKFDEKSKKYSIREYIGSIEPSKKGLSRIEKRIERLEKRLDELNKRVKNASIENRIKRITERLAILKKEEEVIVVNEVEVIPIPNKLWKCPLYLDQGSEGACVGYAWAHELNAFPYNITVKNTTAKTIYYAAQQWDQWEGTEYEGTSVLAGAKVVDSIGHMPEYRWAFGIDDVVQCLLEYGPLVLGINWYSDMFNTNADGFITPTGDLAGGHALLANGIDIKKEVNGEWVDLPDPIIRLHNSWGTSWGVNGDAFITASDLAILLSQQGEACVPVKRS